MNARAHILPPSTTLLERTWDETLPAWEPLADALRTPSEGESAAFLPWYAAEYGLAPFTPYFEDIEQLLAHGLPWLFKRGSAASCAMALAWVGFADARIEEVGARLHINLGRAASSAEISRIAHVVRASCPAHVQFWRVYHGHDRRTLRLDGGQRLDKAMLDDDSGVWISVQAGEPVKASFGQLHRASSPASAAQQPLAWALSARIGRVSRGDLAVLDSWRLDSRLLATEFGGIGELLRAELPPYQRQTVDNAAPGVARITQTAVAASTGTAARHDRAARQWPSVLPQPEGWAGAWDTRAWRPIHIESRATESN